MTSPAPDPSPVNFRFLSVTEGNVVKMELNHLPNSTLLSDGIEACMEIDASVVRSESPYVVTINHADWEIVMFYLQRSGAPVAVTLATALCKQVKVPEGEYQKIPLKVWKKALTAFQQKLPDKFKLALELAKEWVEMVVLEDANTRMQHTLRQMGITPKQLAALFVGLAAEDGHDLAFKMNETITAYLKRMAERHCPPAPTETAPRP